MLHERWQKPEKYGVNKNNVLQVSKENAAYDSAPDFTQKI